MNRNVFLSLVQIALVGIADGIWTGTVQVAFIYIMRGSNTDVGLVEMSYGLSRLVSAYPVGYIADKHGRSPILKVCGAIGIAAAVATAYVIWMVTEDDPDWGLAAFIVCMCAWGILGGVSSGPGQALYADSIPKGNRAKWYTYLQVTWLIAAAVGPAITIVLFTEYGNNWGLVEMRNVMIVGLGFEVLGSFPSFFYDDAKALPEEKNERNDDGDGIQHTRIPYILFASNVVVAAGSGMTVKFFPLFFKNTMSLSPVDVQYIYVATPLAIAALSGLGTTLSKRIGRVESILLTSAVGLTLLVSMALFYGRMGTWGTVAVYIMRTAFMNCNYPVQESILMDSVPKNERARWKSLESVAIFGWCGSAALGGFLVDKYDYTYTFLITAAVQAVGFLPLLLIRRQVRFEKKATTAEQEEPLLTNA